MKAPALIINVPEPCHESWAAMHPQDMGKFCGSCSKVVFDFSNKTDAEIRDILMQHKDQKLCGHFKKTQLGRPIHLSIDLSRLPKNVSATRAFAIAAFLVFGLLLFSCTDHHGKKVDGLDLVYAQEEAYTTTGIALATHMNIEDSIPADSVKTVAIKRHGVQESAAKDTTEEELPMVFDNEGSTTTGVMDIDPHDDDYNNIAYTDSLFLKISKELNDQSSTDEQADGMLIYPNPANGEFTIRYEVLVRADVRIDIYDIQGAWLKNIVDVKAQYEGKYNIPVSMLALPNGIYTVNLINNGALTAKKLVIEK